MRPAAKFAASLLILLAAPAWAGLKEDCERAALGEEGSHGESIPACVKFYDESAEAFGRPTATKAQVEQAFADMTFAKRRLTAYIENLLEDEDTIAGRPALNRINASYLRSKEDLPRRKEEAQRFEETRDRDKDISDEDILTAGGIGGVMQSGLITGPSQGVRKSEPSLARLEEAGNRDPDAYADASEKLAQSGNVNEAAKAADRAVALGPRDGDAWAARARVKAMRGDQEGAVADARKALQFAPDNQLARFIVGNRDQLSASGSRLKGMKLEFGAAAPTERLEGGAGPGAREPSAFGVKAVAFTQFSLPPGAQRFYDAAKIKLGVGDKTGALLDATRAVDAAPESVEALLLRAQISRELGNGRGALDDANRALALSPDDANALRERALAYIQLGRYSDALVDLERAAKLDPENGSTWLYKAMALEKLGMTQEALEALATCVRLTPSLKPAADEISARLKAPRRERERRVDQGVRRLVRGGAIAGSLVLVLLGLLGSKKGREALTTTARALTGRGFEQAARPDAPAADLRPGAVLGNTYSVVRELGRGGMGVVYEAVDTALQRRVAVKQLQRGPETSEADFDRFLQEARTVAKLRHPRLAEIFNVVADGDLYLVFEYVDGAPLDRALESRLRFPLAEARRILGDVAAAVGYAHDQRIIHRDLKPSNVMLESSGAAKVMDFGIAHQSSSAATVLTRTSASGTPPYMAPEQAMGSVSKASDLYALAVMAYELMLGRRPFQGPDFLEQKLTKNFTPPSAVDPALPKGLDAFFARALEPDPTKRFSSAAEFLRSLDASVG